MSESLPPYDPAAGRPYGKRQTLSYLSQLFAAQGLRAKRELGQNFLIDMNLIDLLVRSARIGRDDVVLEVGAGTGGMTTRLVEEAGYVVSVEIDPGFFKLVSVEVENADNITLLHTDILKGKNQLQPVVMETLGEAMNRLETDHYHIVANFPYDVASAVIANCLLHELSVRSMTFTVQLEVAQRLLASPGSRDYGPLSVLVQTLGHGELIRTLKPAAFWPRPKVDSAFVRIEIDPARKTSMPDLAEFHSFIRFLFIHRRKNLRGSIVGIPEFKPLKKVIPELLVEVGLDRDDRAEAIAPPKLYELFHRLTQELKSPTITSL